MLPLIASRNRRPISLTIRKLFRTMSIVKGKPEEAKIVEARHVKDTSDCKWIGLQKIIYKDPNGNEREWDSAVRTTRNSGGVDGIGILTILKYKDGKPDEILLQKQFRPPVEGVCIEMPAGLIDAGEDVDTAALRELKEETGYKGKIISKSPTVFNDPGFTNTNLCLVTVEVDMSLPENQKPVTQLEDNEFIECFSVELHKFPDEMVKLDQQGYKLDARVQNVAQGILMAKQYNIQ
ncbi:ADP-ribose diphosphatase [Saccharomyces eubayanus]|uniref:ADP-ribose diphosphatase n=1 Tax=Saccharomyces eubayanus TaxID=1080349 RepID=UPI0006C3BDF0|nr:YSA1-like protein [Saccharomyces eubayanus]KOH00432.1 YSA1-like protein [Saccharomyces eubayanus]